MKHEIVYALIARWGNTQLARGLPFFSKVNLRQRTEDLHRLGLKVSVARVVKGRRKVRQFRASKGAPLA
jgi:uncharacterized protein (TIGR04141 family)